jgi:lipopolysaccharide transport system ATP-binding protein
MKPAIQIENLSKQYRIGTQARAASRNLTESIVDGASTLWRGLTGRGRGGNAPGEFWALKNVSFEVQPGEVVGIIGRNGAGKSTLLKILSRIAEPTSGRAMVRGRMGSLLEVGTGFHPELTGRENVFLNGSILGMSRREIERKFDEIVAFAEIEQFLDTPVKRYSSGMYVRLAFAVAAHLEPEILIVDEVLAVGDVAFQSKCIRKMREVGSQGRAVLFVSHNLGSLQQLCSRGILLQNGSVTIDLPIQQAVSCYLQTLKTRASEPLNLRTDRFGSGEIRLKAVRVTMDPEGPPSILVTGRQAEFEFEFANARRGVDVSFTIFDDHGSPISNFDTFRPGPLDRLCAHPTNRLVCRIEEFPLLPGSYRMNAMLRVNRVVADQVEGAALFEVQEGLIRGRRPGCHNTWGRVHVPHVWASTEPHRTFPA